MAVEKAVQGDGTRKRARWLIRRRRRSGGIRRGGDGRGLKQLSIVFHFLRFLLFFFFSSSFFFPLIISFHIWEVTSSRFAFHLYIDNFFFFSWNNGSGKHSSSTRGQVTEGE